MGLRSLFSEADETNGDVIPQRQFGGSDVSAGAELGLRGMQSAGYELINDPAGAAYARAQAAGVPVRFRSSDDVDWTSPSDIVDYAQQQAGQFAPSGALSLAGAGLGAGLSRTIMGAAAENLTKAQLAERAASMASGARVGSTIASGAQQYGDMAGELRAQGKEPGAGTLGLSALGGVSETFKLEKLFKGLVASAGKDAIEAGVKSTLASRALQGAAAGIGKAQLTEVPTEVFQEGLAIANRSLYDPAYRENTDDMWRRTKETAIATAAGAGLAGAAPGAIGGLRSTPGSTPEVTPGVGTEETKSAAPGATQPTDRFGLPITETKQAPSHDMSLDELRALDSSTSPGETYGESQNATQESALPPNETGQRQEVLEPAGATAPAPVSSRAQRAFEYFQGKGLPAHTAAGIVGALTGESSRQLSPGIVNPRSGAFGIAQWLGSRVRELDAFAKQRGKPIDDFDTQLDFVWHELNNKEAGAFAHVKNAPDAVTASDLFTTKFERPGKHELRLEPRRAAALDLLSGKPVGTTAAQMEAGPPDGLPRRGIDETPDERAERIRRSVAGENQYQDTALGRAIKGQTETDNEQTGQSYADEGLQFEDTDDGFSLTFKGRKRESTGDDLMRPSRPLPEAEDDTFEGMTPESTPVRAFSEALYPGAKIEISGKDTPNLQRIVSVQFPEEQRQALGEDQKYVARASLEALVSGTKADPKDKILLEHPDVVSSKSDNPIEIPVTKDGLAKLGRALDPGAYDSAPSASHAAAVSGLTHLIYEKGFVPRGVDIKKLEQANEEVKKLGKKPFEIVKAPSGQPTPEGVVDGHRGPNGRNITNAAPNTPGWLGNPFVASDVKGGKLSRKEAVDKFREVFLQRVNNDPAFRDAVLALRGKKVGYYKPDEKDIHLQVVQDWLASQGTQNQAPSTKPAVATQQTITRNDVRGNPKTLYLFGDNDLRKGLGGQAKAMRGEANAVGIRTKAKPSTSEDSYWSDDTYEENIKKIDEDLKKVEAHQGPIIIPEAGLGTGLSELPQRAPKTYAYLQAKLEALKSKRQAPSTKPSDPIGKWIEEKLGKAPVDRTPERVAPEQEDRKVGTPVLERDQSGRTIGRGRAAYQPLVIDQDGGLVAAPDASGATPIRLEQGQYLSVGDEGAPLRSRVTWDNDSLFPATPAASNINNLGTSRKQGVIPDPSIGGFTGEDSVPYPEYESKPGYTPLQQATLSKLTQLAQKYVRKIGPEPTDPAEQAKWDKQKQAAWNAAIDRAAREIDPASIQLPLTTFTHELGADGKTPEPVMLRREDAPRRSGVRQPRKVSANNIAAAAKLAKQEFSAALYARRRNTERDELISEAGKNLDSMPLRDELTEDQLLATEAEAGVAEDRAAMRDRQRGLTSSFSPAQAKQQTRRSVENTTNKIEDTAKRTRELDSKSIETVHKVSSGATVRATGVSDKVVRFFTEALKDIGLEVPLRVMSKAGITQHLDALQQRLDGLVEAIQREEETLSRMPNMLKEEKKARKEQEKKVLTLRRALQDASREQELLLQAQEDEFAARVIYNDHYQDATRRTPIIVVSDEAAASKHLTKVLGHELGHVVQRAWFDQLPSDLKMGILQELSENGAYTDDIAEAFADKFLSWYERNKRGEKIKDKQEGIRAKKMEGVLQRLVNALQRLWNNLVGHDKAFAKEYPKFDEFLRSTVGVYGRMKTINPEINKLWTESLAQPYGGLPLAVADRERFNNMTVDEFNQTVTDAAKQRLDQAQKWASGKPIAQKQVTKDYIDRFNATIDAMKTGARYWLVAEGERLRGSFEGLFAGWGDVYAPQVGIARTGGQVIKGRLHTNRIMGTFDNHVKRIAAKYLKPKTALLGQYNKLSDAEKTALLANVRDERMPAKSPLARDIRTYFRLLRSGLIDAGVLDPKQRKQNYTAKMWGAGKFADLKMRNEIIDRFTKVFEARQELPVETRERMRVENPDGTHYYGWHEVRYTSAKRAAEDLYERISTGQTDSIIDQDPEAIEKGLRSSAFPFSRSRPFSEDEYAAYNLHEFLEDDLGYIIQNYTQQAAKRIAQIEATGIPRDQLKDPKTRAAWKARFEAAKLDPQLMYTPTAALDLLLAEGVVDGRIGTKDEYNEARSLLMSSLGMKNVGTSPRRRRWINRIVAYQTILTMPWSAFSALSDFGIAAWRGESLERAGEALSKTFGKESRAKQENLLRLIGLALEESTRHAMQSDTVMAADPMARGSHRMTEAFFKWNGMEYLSHTNMIFASVLGQSYIKDYADQAVNGKTEKERADAMKRLRMLHPDMTPHHVLTAEFDTDDQLQVALMEFISQAHLHDQKGYTPEVFNDYRFKIFTMLKGFSFKYHNIVLKQVWERMKDQPDLLHAAIPVVTLAAATMPLALAGMEAKDLLRRRLLPQTKRMKEKTAAQKLHDVVMASGLPGVYVSMFDDMLEAPQHGQPGFIALMGPVIGSAYNFSARSLDESIPAYTPGVAYFPWFRAMARQGLRDTFGFGVRDEKE